ncbi:rod shape-determining protein RodA [Maritimibacter sp. 55A14]|nr:DUF4399 domain-containing protein [Maritimibacter sp. 55A14]PWE33221.1 rod shape-determining protein RodA [Maritimibacter sp. 55A14]
MFARIGAVALCLAAPAFAGDAQAPEGAELYFVNLEDGARVSSPVTVIFGLKGMGVAPAGTEAEGAGHHHLFIDRSAYSADKAAAGIPKDAYHRHFGAGETQVELMLSPGEHSLQLVLGDANHAPHDPPVASDRIVITVE